MKQIKLDCGKHYGKGGACSKCRHFATLPPNYARNARLVAAVRPAHEYDTQERAIANAFGIRY